MFDFLNKKDLQKKDKDETFVEIACLLIHASKIDENYTNNEKEIIKKTLINLKCLDNEVENIIEKALEIEGNSNQILDFTRKLKDVEEDKKVSIIEALWKIIYSDKKSDKFITTKNFLNNPKGATPISEVIRSINWIFDQEKNIVGGRNFSTAFDPWGEENPLNTKLIEELRKDSNMYKLMRSGNDLFPKKRY